jgi:acetyl-CoA decarbonylase/synthase complex subunit delta
MAFEEPKESFGGRIRQVVGGDLKIGGENCLPFHIFEGEMPNPPRIALEVYDSRPLGWPEACLEPYRDVLDDPVEWARKCVRDYGAEMVCLQLISTDPTGQDTPAQEAGELARRVADAIDVPLIVYGTSKVEKDEEVLKSVAASCEGKNVILGPVQEGNYKGIGAAAIGYKHNVAASTPIDVNLAKQLNILLGNLGVSEDKIIIDPTTGGLGYGLEYTYSVMERDRLAALAQNDTKMQMPMIANIGKEVWKIKELKVKTEEEPAWGDAEKRGILWEAITAISLALAGADILIMRHPKAASLVKETMNDLID